MLQQYILETQRYLQFDERQAVYNPADLTDFINLARDQIALGSECLRQPAQLALTAGQMSYNFGMATFYAEPVIIPGLLQVANIRSARILLPTNGKKRLEMRAWEYFETFYLDRTIPLQDNPGVPGGMPTICTRLQPGLSGTIWFLPVPDQPYTVNLDAVAWPDDLVYANGDGDPEALPRPWRAAVPMLAAHFAYLSDGDQEGAARMLAEYETFERRAVQMTTPSRLPRMYPGGMGAQLANAKIPLTMPQAARR